MNDNTTHVLITVDTEHSIGGAFHDPKLKPVGNEKRIYGNVAGREYGIPLIMDIADQYNLKVVFFVEVLNKYYFGEQETREVCEYILKRGHEVQLHLHPHYLNFAEQKPEKLKYKDNFFQYNLDEQSRLLQEGRNLLQQYGVKNPRAFRAGNYGFNRSTLIALKQNSFLFDSSYNYTFLKSTQGFENMVINDAQLIDGIYEFPITNFIQTLPFKLKQPKPLDINGVSSEEMILTLDWANKTRLIRYVTIILHSFSFLEPLDAQYSKVKIRDYVIRRFDDLCQFLFQNREKFNVIGFNELNSKSLVLKERSPLFLKMPKISSLKRLSQQVLHRID